MKMTIQTPHIKAETGLLDFVLSKVGRLGAFSEKILECEVNLKVIGRNDLINKVIELKLIIPGHELVASSQSKTFEESIMNALEAVKPQLERWKRAVAS